MQHPVLHALWQAVASFLVPESLAIEKTRHKASRRGVFELVAPRAALLSPCDLIVVRTPGTFYSLFRSAAKHKVDHLAIVMENGQFLHVGPPTIRLLPVELLLTPNRRPLVFRPKLSDEEKARLLRSLYSLVGQQYDTVRVYSFVARLALHAYFGARFPLKPLVAARRKESDLLYSNHGGITPLQSGVWKPKGEGSKPNEQEAQALAAANHAHSRLSRITTIGGRQEENVDSAPFLHARQKVTAAAHAAADAATHAAQAVICTDAILPRLLSASAEWRAALSDSSPVASRRLRSKLDFFKLRSWSINDVFQVSKLRPDLLQRLHLPPIQMPEEFKDLDDLEKEMEGCGGKAQLSTLMPNSTVDAAKTIAARAQHILAQSYSSINTY